MISFFQAPDEIVYAVHSSKNIVDDSSNKLEWLFSGANLLNEKSLEGNYLGPRKEMLNPWSTNAVEITQNMGIEGIIRIERFIKYFDKISFDPMLEAKFDGLNQTIFTIDRQPEPIQDITDIAELSH